MWNLLKASKWNELSWHGDRCLCWGAGWLVLAVHQASRLLWPVKAHLTAKTLRIMIQEKAPGIKLQNGGKRTVLLAKQFYTAWALLCIEHPTSSSSSLPSSCQLTSHFFHNMPNVLKRVVNDICMQITQSNVQRALSRCSQTFLATAVT